jgi:hypothetical protein
MRHDIATAAILGLMLLSLQPGHAADTPTSYQVILGHYEEVRQALLHDTLEGVPPSATKIAVRARALGESFAPEAAGVTEKGAEECRANLPVIADAADRLQEASTLAEAREAFEALSKAMIRYRRLATRPESVVVYCSMAEKVWMQPEGEIGNPYYGQSMAACGEVVSQ